MKPSVSKSMAICLIVLSGYSSASASPTYQPACFETEEAAKAHQSAYKFHEVDNSEASQKDHRAMKFAWKDDVLLSDLQAILGKSQKEVDDKNELITHKWELYFVGSPSTDEIRYDASKGYCVNTRMGGFGTITYTWKPEVFDETRGSLTRSEFYM